jgi:cytidine deaminase
MTPTTSRSRPLQRVKLEDLDPRDRELVAAARDARENAYTPYSNHKVGAAVRASGGRVYAACNVEIVTLQQSVHAERNAVNLMAAGGDRMIEAVVCHGPYSGIPCAECRQVIWEFAGANPDVRIISAPVDGAIDVLTIGEIYPLPYGPETKSIDPRQY